jgi:predicted DsbA family dithiol-disulfide isomerase
MARLHGFQMRRVDTFWQAITLAACVLVGVGYSVRAIKYGWKSSPLAVVAGKRIYDSNLPLSTQTQLQQLRYREYQVKRRALVEIVDQFLLDAEAKKKGTSSVKLLAEAVDSTIPKPSEDELQAAYASQNNSVSKPFTEVRPQIESSLREERVRRARTMYFSQLRAQNNVVFLLEPPESDMQYDPNRARGNPKAPVLIVEFADFQCPFSRQFQATLRNVITKYEGRLRVAFRDFPLRDIHPMAEIAAEAARCAGQQGKFWEYHDLLFENPDKLDRLGLSEEARSLNLDEKKFDLCLSSGEYRSEIQRDIQDGRDLGVTGAPGVFINGTYFEGALPEAILDEIIRGELTAVH